MKLARHLILPLAIALASFSPAALAIRADPSHSSISVQVPTLAPGEWGNAPCTGEWDRKGGFTIRATTANVTTGTDWHTQLLRRFVRGTIVLKADAPRSFARTGRIRRARTTGTLYVANTAYRLPLIYRLVSTPHGQRLNTFFKVPLAPYGVRTPQGGHPGDVNVAIEAFFPGR